jgi:hypothetical protein
VTAGVVGLTGAAGDPTTAGGVSDGAAGVTVVVGDATTDDVVGDVGWIMDDVDGDGVEMVAPAGL